MNDPPQESPSREDLKEAKDSILARISSMDEQIENMRSQNSAENSAIQSTLVTIREVLVWLKTQWTKFTRS